MGSGEQANQSGRSGESGVYPLLTSARLEKLSEAWRGLTAPSPVLVCGPRYMGRRHLVREIELKWVREKGGVVARAHLGVADSPAALLQELGRSLGLLVTLATDFLLGLRKLASLVGRPLLLEVGGYEAVVDDMQRRTRFGDAFRDVAAQMAFQRFPGDVALLLVGEGRPKRLVPPDYYRREIQVVGLDMMTVNEAGELVRGSGLHGEFIGLWEPTGGVPGLLVPALEYALRTGASARQILQQAASPESPFGPVFINLSHELRRDAEASALWRRVAKLRVASGRAEVEEKLLRLGLAVVQDGGGIIPRCVLFRTHVTG